MLRAALFDMDRTLVRRHTSSLYVRYQREIGEAGLYELLRASFWVAQYTLGLLDAPKVAERALADFRGRDAAALTASCAEWYARWVRPHVCEAGREAVRRHRAAGDVVAIVTAATTYAARPLADDLGIEHVVASELELADGKLTGRAIAPLCYGAGKISRTEALADRLGFSLASSAFYTDSATDLPLLERVGERVIVNPDPRMRRIARRRGWRIERW